MDLSPVGRASLPRPRQHGELARERAADRAAADLRRAGRVGATDRRGDRDRRPHPGAPGRPPARRGGARARAGTRAPRGDLPRLRRARGGASSRARRPGARGSRAPRRVPRAAPEPHKLGLHSRVATRRRPAPGPAGVGRRPLGRRGADHRRSAAPQAVPGRALRLGLSRRHPERHAALVRQGGVRQPRQGPELLRPPSRPTARRLLAGPSEEPMNRRATRGLTMTLALVALTAWSRAEAAEIKVLSTVGMQPATAELIPRFERETGHTVVVTYGLAAVLKTQFLEGAPADGALLPG